MEDESDLVREAVIKSLSLLPSPARTSLLEALSHPSALARQAACQALGKMGHDAKDAADKLFALLSMSLIKQFWVLLWNAFPASMRPLMRILWRSCLILLRSRKIFDKLFPMFCSSFLPP